MEALHNLVEYWRGIKDEDLNQRDCYRCHGAYGVQFLIGGIWEEEDYRHFPTALVDVLGYGNPAQVILMLRQAGAGKYPLELSSWENRHAIYDKLMEVEKLPSLAGEDLSYSNFSRMDLSGADMSGANCKMVNFSHTLLVRADLSGANCQDADFSFSDLSYTRFNGANLDEAVFDHAREISTIWGHTIEAK